MTLYNNEHKPHYTILNDYFYKLPNTGLVETYYLYIVSRLHYYQSILICKIDK